MRARLPLCGEASGPCVACCMISVLIADDQDLVREDLRMMLEAEPDLSVAGEKPPTAARRLTKRAAAGPLT